MSSRPSSLAVVAASVLLSVSAALAVSLMTRTTDHARSGSGAAAPSSVERPGGGAGFDAQALEERLARLERRVEAMSFEREVATSAGAAPPSGGESRSGRTDRASLLERITSLERQMLGNRATEAELTPEERETLELERRRKREEEIQTAQATLLDPTATVSAKIAAHEALRRVPDAYTPGMVADLAHIGANDAEAEIRADVWRLFDGSSHLPALVPHLRTALLNDVDPRVRSEAAETLGNYLSDPAVIELLRQVAESDQSAEVRRKIARTLGEWSAWLAENR